MPTLHFLPSEQSIAVDANTKVLVGATRQKLSIRFGCAACRCGTCGVAVQPVAGEQAGTLSPIKPDELALLKRMGLALDGSIRLACQARIMAGTVAIDLDFQNQYSPDEASED